MSRKTRNISRSKSYRSHKQLGHEQLETRQMMSAASLIPAAPAVDQVAIPAFESMVEVNVSKADEITFLDHDFGKETTGPDAATREVAPTTSSAR